MPAATLPPVRSSVPSGSAPMLATVTGACDRSAPPARTPAAFVCASPVVPLGGSAARAHMQSIEDARVKATAERMEISSVVTTQQLRTPGGFGVPKTPYVPYAQVGEGSC